MNELRQDLESKNFDIHVSTAVKSRPCFSVITVMIKMIIDDIIVAILNAFYTISFNILGAVRSPFRTF